MLILGIESSCDETGAAVTKHGCFLLSNVVASRLKFMIATAAWHQKLLHANH